VVGERFVVRLPLADQENQGRGRRDECHEARIQGSGARARDADHRSATTTSTTGPRSLGPYAGRREEVTAVWWRDMKVLATCANVSVKLGGLGMEICGFGLHARSGGASSDDLVAWAPYIEHCIQEFGPDRVMFESNFPVDRFSCDYVYRLLALAARRSEFSDDFVCGAKIALREGPLTFSAGFDPVANEIGNSDWPTRAISGVD
jgi:hypothetical protein